MIFLDFWERGKEGGGGDKYASQHKLIIQNFQPLQNKQKKKKKKKRKNKSDNFISNNNNNNNNNNK